MHWPQSSQVESFKGISKAVDTSTQAARSLNVRAWSICTSWQIRMQRPQRMHFPGRYRIASLPVV
jgi:hypothetical protein